MELSLLHLYLKVNQDIGVGVLFLFGPFLLMVIGIVIGRCKFKGMFLVGLLAVFTSSMLMITGVMASWASDCLINDHQVSKPVTASTTFKGDYHHDMVFIQTANGFKKTRVDELDYQPATKQHPQGSQTAKLLVWESNRKLSVKDQQQAKRLELYRDPEVKVTKYV